MHTSTSTKMLKEFFKLYADDFSFSCMSSFLVMGVEQEDGCIKLQLDIYMQEMLDEYKNYIKRDLNPRKSPCNLGSHVDQIWWSKRTEILPVDVRKGSVRCSLDSFQCFILCSTLGSILCFGRCLALGGASSLDGVSRAQPKFQIDVSRGPCFRSRLVCRFELG